MPFTVKKTLDVVVETGNHALVQVKENQGTLYGECQYTAETLSPTACYVEPPSKERNRIEQRHIRLFDTRFVSDTDKWGCVRWILEVHRHREVFDTTSKTWKTSDERAFYLATADESPQRFLQQIRQHWSIENRNHHVRDVTFNEDKSRIRVNPQNMAKLRSFALNIMRANQVKNIRQERFINALNLDNIFQYHGIKEN